MASRPLAAGFLPRPSLNLHFFGGKTIADLIYVNRYLGGPGAWDPADVASIDAALAKAMSDNALQSVLQQYYRAGHQLAHAAVGGAARSALPATDLSRTRSKRSRPGSTAAAPSATPTPAAPSSTSCCRAGWSWWTASRRASGRRRAPKPSTSAACGPWSRSTTEDADSRHGLGGYHGSTNVAGTAVYYAVGVYSEDGNGIPAFDQPWKNVAATFYHELNEARTDPDVEDAIRTGDSSRLGWYSAERRRGRRHPDQRGRDQPRPRLHRNRAGRRLGRRPGPADVVEQGRRACPPHRLASPSLPCGVAQPSGGPRQGSPGWPPRRPVNARWFAAWTTGFRLPPARPRPAGSAKGFTAKDAEFPHCPFLPQ